MDAKIITGLLLCFCFMASISISQSASARRDSRLRFRRQNEANLTCPKGKKPCKDDNKKCAAYCDGNPECTDASDELDCVTIASVTIATTAVPQSARPIGNEIERADVPEATTDVAEATLPQVSVLDRETIPPADAGSTANDVEQTATTAASNTGAAETVTAILADGTTIVLPDGTTATVNAEDATTAGTAEPDSTGEASEGTTAGDTTGEAVTEATGATGTLETATADTSESSTDSVTSVKPGNGHVTEDGDASNDTSTSADGLTSASGATVDEGATTTADNETSTAVVPGGAGDDDNNGTRSDSTEAPVNPSPGQPGGRVELRVVVNPDVIQVQRGRTAELTCTVYGGDSSTTIYWIQEEPERRYAVLDPASESDKQVSASQVTLRARITIDDTGKLGKYTCMAQDAAGNSGTAMLTLQEGGGYYPQQPVYPGQNDGYYPQQPVYPPVAPSGGSGYLRIVAPDMVDGDYVEIQCEGASAEDEGRIQWYFNNRQINDEQPLYPRGKTLHIRPISRPYLGNYRCSIPGSGYTDANSVLTFGGVVPGPAPVQPVQPILPVQPTTGRCGIDEATCRNGRCIPRAYLCDGKNDCGDNSDESCGRSDICQPNEIHCSDPNRGRKCVQKFWMCDGDRDCDDGSDEEQRYCELLPRQRYCKPSEFQCTGVNGSYGNPVCIPRSFQCDGYNDCPDRSDEVGCVKPTIVSPPQRQIQVNAGETLTIQCTARGSPAPYINWRLNWGHVCGDGSDNGRCTMAQALDSGDITLVTGTLTVRNVNANDGGAYSCEALNNQGFIFAIPDAIVNVIIEPGPGPTSRPCNCHGHSSYCTPDGRCQNCQHNTYGDHCEYCAPGHQGDARRGTIYDCQPIAVPPPPSTNCNPLGTHMERGGRCICKYNVEGDRCDQCKRSHFYLNPTTPNGCLPCFCSGVSSDCSSSDWRRQARPLPLNNWNVVPKNFATDRYEGRDRIQQRNGGRELAIDQSSLGRPGNEVLYWKAPKEVLGDLVTLYDGTIDIHFTNDGNGNHANGDEVIWLRGNNIDLVHKLPQTQQFQPNSNATYSVPCNERTFTRKDGTYIDRENILMALSDLDTLLIKINPIGGRKNAVLRGVTLNVAARDGYADTAFTVESCRCPANYTGTSCEKCAEGYGRPHPLVGIYLGQCWSCRALCHDRSDQCDRETGKCSNCQGNSEGDRCERCRAGYTLDPRSNQCVRGDGRYEPEQPPYEPPREQPPYEPGLRGAYYIDQKPYDSRTGQPLAVVLDGSQPEQRVPLQVLNDQPQSIVWGRTDGSSLPANVVQEGNDLVFRNPSSDQGGNYICTITHPDGYVERLNVYVDYRPGQSQPQPGPGYGYPLFSPPSPLTVDQGASQFIQPPAGYSRAQWSRADGQPLPSGVYQNGNTLQILDARPDHSGTYYCLINGPDGRPINIPYEVRIQPTETSHTHGGSAPKITIQPRVINLKEGQRMIVQYTVASHDPIVTEWRKLTPQGPQPISSLFTDEPNRLVLQRATPDIAGTYQVTIRNRHGQEQQDLTINVEPRRGRGRGQQAGAGAGAPQIAFQQDQYEVGYGESVHVAPTISGANGAQLSWSKDGSPYLPAGVTAHNDGSLHIVGQSNDVAGSYNLDVTNANGRASRPISVRWRETSNQQGSNDNDQGQDQDRPRSYIDVRLQSRDEQSHQIGRDVNLQCAVHGSVERPYEYTFTKDGQPLENHIEVHPDGLLVLRNVQAHDAGRYRCEVTFPRAPEAGTQESSYDLRLDGGSAGHHDQSHQQGGDYGQPQGYVEVTAEPNEVNVGRGEKATVTCNVKGAQDYKVTWGKYAHDTSLPSYIRQEGNSVVIAPTDDTPGEVMHLQCQVDVPGHAQAYHAYAPVNVRGGDESSKKKKKRRS